VKSVLAWLACLLSITPAVACGGSDPCRVDGGEYLLMRPGEPQAKPPGLLIFVHGHRSSAAEMLAYGELVTAARALNMVLVAPQGLNATWSTPGAPSTHRDETGFIRRVIDDLPSRLTFDRERVLLSGFSQGASVVWHVACAGEPRIKAFMPIAGVWWQPMPETCPGGPVKLLHVHGLADPVMPMTGRAIRDTWRQGDVREAVARMIRHNMCSADRIRTETGSLACEAPKECRDGAALKLCLHPGDHHTDPRWFMDQREWIERAFDPQR
jgi:polyhydroxybutyrate depolymerase